MPDREVFDARSAVGVAQNHPAVAVAVLLGAHARGALAPGRGDDFFHLLQGGFELTGRERLKDDRRDTGRLDPVLG